jgi:Na+/citrate or Na+/malate symporter
MRYHPRIKNPRDPLVNDEIMLIGEMFVVGGGGGRGNIPMSEGYLNIPTPTCI